VKPAVNVRVVGYWSRLSLPGVSPVAMQQGRFVARQIKADLAGGKARETFHYVDKGSMATIGRTRAVAQIGRLEFAGLPAFLLWGLVHLAYLVGWGSLIEAVDLSGRSDGRFAFARSGGAADIAGFTLTNSKIAAVDVIQTSIVSGATAGAYDVTVDAVAAGSCRISIYNRTAAPLSEAIVINFAVIKGSIT